MALDIVDCFNTYFEIVLADTDQLKHEVYKLRYQVYCNETSLENPDNHPEGIETDEYDANSVHYLIVHTHPVTKVKSYAATTRMILPDYDYLDRLFPVERFTQILRNDLVQDGARTNLGEASRFCVSKEFKKRKNEAGTLIGINDKWENDFTENERRVLPHLSVGLFACLIKASYDYKIYRWIAVMEPALVRFFLSLGIHFDEIGPLVEYHGKRKPYTIKVSDLLAGAKEKNSTYWDLITNRGEFVI